MYLFQFFGFSQDMQIRLEVKSTPGIASLAHMTGLALNTK